LGRLQIYKNSEDGKVSGISFEVTEVSSGMTLDVMTDGNGYTELYLKEGTYEIREIVPEGYNDVPAETVEITAGKTENVLFFNSLIKFYNLEVNYFERATGAKLENSVFEIMIEGSSYNLYDEVMLPIDGYIWDGYEGDDFKGENLSSDKVIDVYYVMEPVAEPDTNDSGDMPLKEPLPETDDTLYEPFVCIFVLFALVMPVFTVRKRFYEQ